MNRNFSAFDKEITQAEISEYIKNTPRSSFMNIVGMETVVAVGIPFVVFGSIFVKVPAELSNAFYISSMAFMVVYFLVILVVLRRLFQKRLLSRIQLSRFSSDNGLKYYPSDFPVVNNGMIFSIGNDRHYHDVLQSESDQYFEIGNYEYTVGSGKNKKTVTGGYTVMRLDRKLPHMVLDSKKNNFNLFGMSISNLPVSYDKDQVLSLEGDFDSYFTLYAPKEYERDALYVFNPALMALFIDESSKFDAEIVDDKLYIYSEKEFDLSNRSTLQKIFRVIDTVMDKTADGTKRYSDERVGSFEANAIYKSGHRLKKNWRWVGIVVVVIYIALMIFNIVFNN